MATIICATPNSQSRKRSSAYLDDFPSSKRINRSCVEFGITRLRSLFPDMDDEALKNVLDSCGHDVDAAIEKLTSLRLTPPPQQEKAEPPQERTLESADDWVSALVTEMKESRDVTDAKSRAARVLSAFEQFVASRTAEKQSQLDKENNVLKRAVAIQAQRLAEAKDDKIRDQNTISQLRKNADDQNEKLKQAQLSNYSLSVHLRRATDSAALRDADGATGGFPRHPDVY